MNRTYIVIGIFALIIILGVIAYSLRDGLGISEPPKQNFAESGVLLRDTPELSPDTWYIRVENEGAPTVTLPLIFTTSSRCMLGETAETICPSLSFLSGDLVRVEGFEEENAVRVTRIVRQGSARDVQLFYYNEAKDTDAEGNVACSRAGLDPVIRKILSRESIIEDTLKLLLRGDVTEDELSRGISTEFPLSGLKLDATSLTNGELTVTFSDPDDVITGGACRTRLLQLQIEETAKQFPEVREVRFTPVELLQP